MCLGGEIQRIRLFSGYSTKAQCTGNLALHDSAENPPESAHPTISHTTQVLNESAVSLKEHTTTQHAGYNKR
jgi:hypothetical protein